VIEAASANTERPIPTSASAKRRIRRIGVDGLARSRSTVRKFM
jgi:hypothetical protein